MKGIILLIILSFSISGCSLIPKIEKNNITQISDIKLEESNQKLIFSNEKWWTIYNDSSLNKLMDLILKSNEDLSIANLNIEKADKAISLISSQKGPTVDLIGNARREKLAEHGTVPPPFNGLIEDVGYLGLQADYEIDIFNRIKSLSQEAEYKKQALELNSKWIEMNISSKTARLYFYWIYLLKENEILSEEKIKINELKNLEQIKFAIGNGIEDDVLKAENSLRQINALIEENILNQNLTVNNLNLLSGNKYKEEIQELLNSVSKETTLEVAAPDSVISDVIVNRPDVAYYLAMIKAQEKHLKSAKADFYPRFSITGKYGFDSVEFNDVLKRSSLAGFIGGSLYLPIFHMGEIRTNYKIAGIDLNIFIEEYNKAVVNAYTDVNNELYKTKTAKSNLEKSDKNLLNERNIFENNKKRYDIGSISKLQYTADSINWLNSKLENEKYHFNFIVQQLNLINSFGGTYNNLGGENGAN